jgi:hypothetical protein
LAQLLQSPYYEDADNDLEDLLGEEDEGDGEGDDEEGPDQDIQLRGNEGMDGVEMDQEVQLGRNRKINSVSK